MTIYIRPDGTISGSNEPLPVKPYRIDMFTKRGIDLFNAYMKARTAWMESFKNFEDQEQATDLCRNGQDGAKYQNWKPTPDTIIENVDVETEVVEEIKTSGEFVIAKSLKSKKLVPVVKYRTVLRIKDKP